MVMMDQKLDIRKTEMESSENIDLDELNEINSETNSLFKEYSNNESGKFEAVLNCLPTIKDTNSKYYGMVEPAFSRYLTCYPWRKPFFYDYEDPYNDLIILIYGSRGAGKTTTAAAINTIDGMMRGIPLISNVPISWVAKDNRNKLYKIQSIPFDVEKFVRGDIDLKYKRLLLDEGNYLADRLRSTSNKNLAITDILQQARKFRMTITFSTINYLWLDPRVTSSLADVTMECSDFYYDPYYRNKYHLKKGEWIGYDAKDVSGKLTGTQNNDLDTGEINIRKIWGIVDTEHFVDPRKSRQRLASEERTIIDETGNEIPVSQWYKTLEQRVNDIPDGEYSPRDWWKMVGVQDDGLKLQAGKFFSKLGIQKTGYGKSNYCKEMGS